MTINRMTEDGLVKIMQDILSDGSTVYNVRVRVGACTNQPDSTFDIACVNIEAAEELFYLLEQADKYLL